MLNLAGSQASGGNSLRKLKAQPAPAYGFRSFPNYRLRVIAQCG
jgi:transposase